LRARQERRDPLETKVHPRRMAEDAKFEDSRGFIIDPTGDAESRQLEEASTDRRRSEMRGDPEINPSAAATDLRFRATWRLVSQSAPPEE